MSFRESPRSEPKTRIVGFDINHDDRVADLPSAHQGKAVDDHNESPTSILELLPAESPNQASFASSQSKLSLTSSSRECSSGLLSNMGDGESPPKSHLAEELRRHASMNLDNSMLDEQVKQALPRLKVERK